MDANQSRAQQRAAKLIGLVDRDVLEIREIETDLQTRINQLVKETALKTRPLERRVNRNVRSLMSLAEEDSDIFPEGRKSLKVSTGEFGWRDNPESVLIAHPKRVLRYLRNKNLMKYVRVSYAIDKTALLRDKEVAVNIEGVAIGRGKHFFVKPRQANEILKREGGRFRISVRKKPKVEELVESVRAA